MIGILLMLVGSVFAEVSSSISKLSAEKRLMTHIDIGIITLIASILPFGIAAAVHPSLFILNPVTFPTMALRIVLEVVLMIITLQALVTADRSTFSFIRTLTIPLLLVVDIAIGYDLTITQVAGAAIILLVLVLNSVHGINRKGQGPLLLSTFLAVITISLYKYNITYNSVVAEQLIITGMLLPLLIVVRQYSKEKSEILAILKDKGLRAGFVASMLAHVLESFAYKYIIGTALVLAVKRAAGVLLSIISGKAIFHEEHLVRHSIVALALVGGIIVMALPEHFAYDASSFIARVLP